VQLLVFVHQLNGERILVSGCPAQYFAIGKLNFECFERFAECVVRILYGLAQLSRFPFIPDLAQVGSKPPSPARYHMTAVAPSRSKKELFARCRVTSHWFSSLACAKKRDDELRLIARHGKGRHLRVWNPLSYVADDLLVRPTMPPAASRQVGRPAALGIFAMATRALFLEEGFARLGGLHSRIRRPWRRDTQDNNWKKRNFHRL
jgi:hypothetical protein